MKKKIEMSLSINGQCVMEDAGATLSVAEAEGLAAFFTLCAAAIAADDYGIIVLKNGRDRLAELGIDHSDIPLDERKGLPVLRTVRVKR